MKTPNEPINVRREVKAATTAINTELATLNSKLSTLNSMHGPGKPSAYAPEILKRKDAELRQQSADRVVEKFNAANDSVRDLKTNVDYFSRKAIMERAPLPVPTRPPLPTSQEASQSVVDALETNFEFNRARDDVRDANDEGLTKLAAKAVQGNHLRLAAEISGEAEKRGGLMALKVGKILDELKIPTADKFEEDLELLDDEVRTMKSAFNTLSTGGLDTYAQMTAAMSR